MQMCLFLFFGGFFVHYINKMSLTFGHFYYWCNHSVTVYDTGALQFRLGCHLTLMLLQEFFSDQLLCYQQIMELLSIGSQVPLLKSAYSTTSAVYFELSALTFSYLLE